MPTRSIPILDVDALIDEIRHNDRFLFESPCIVDGHATRWPGFELWSDYNFLRSRFGKFAVKAGAPQFTTSVGQSICEVETTFSDYLSYLEDQQRAEVLFEGKWRKGSLNALNLMNIPLYCGSLRFVRNPEQAKIADLSPLLPETMEHWNDIIPYFYTLFNHFWLYVSARGALTPLHIDNNFVCTYLAQLKGRKLARLYAPDESPLYFKRGYGYVDPEQPDTKLFANFSEATCWEAELGPGQTLFFGPRWAHQVRTLEDSVTFSFDFVNQTNVEGFILCGEWFSALANFWRSMTTEAVSEGTGMHAPLTDWRQRFETGRTLASELLERKLASCSDDMHNAILERLLELTRAAYAAHD